MRTLLVVIATGLLSYSGGVVSGFRAYDWANTYSYGAARYVERDRQQLTRFVKQLERERKRCQKLRKRGIEPPRCKDWRNK